MWQVAAALGTTALTSSLNSRNARRAARQARALGKANANLVAMETAYELSNLDQIVKDTIGDVDVAIGSSGLSQDSVSLQATRTALQTEFDKQRNWLVASGAQREKIAKLGGQMQARNITSAAQSENLNTALRAFNTVGQTNNWWQ